MCYGKRSGFSSQEEAKPLAGLGQKMHRPVVLRVSYNEPVTEEGNRCSELSLSENGQDNYSSLGAASK